ncbi:MAG: 30S ribosomal protein S2 [bacterium]|nr:30S ribosomal protein S2 [bacterium]
MSNVDIKALFEAGAHFGHKTSRWHPKMAPYIHSKRGGTHIIDLAKTVPMLEAATAFIEKQVAAGKQILLVSTKRQVQDVLQAVADETGMPFVTSRWLGGMMTNYNTMSVRIKHLKDLEAKMASGELANKYNKLEVQRYQEEIDSMNEMYGGIKNMHQKVGGVFVLDIINDHNAVAEAKKLGIPVIALVDTNTDPTDITYPIPCNDDALKAVQLVMSEVQNAIKNGQAGIKADKTEEATKTEDK